MRLWTTIVLLFMSLSLFSTLTEKSASVYAPLSAVIGHHISQAQLSSSLQNGEHSIEPLHSKSLTIHHATPSGKQQHLDTVEQIEENEYSQHLLLRVSAVIVLFALGSYWSWALVQTLLNRNKQPKKQFFPDTYLLHHKYILVSSYRI